ncbi:hypothetical protein PAPYR_642 [Paratrimastix pyriformis]|uniref:Uncharacterized protein n=1 Tax=Paratrimastix pyriformis TaxID=342808 RepID=A0ABQ8V0N6_9EUKA|nr:hypothetical protein PAPYR_642 [Paratrimastix pyriformis]
MSEKKDTSAEKSGDPNRKGKRSNRPLGSAPPEIVKFVPGSTAGAGSGEFHVYRHLRRKELYRLRMMDRDAEKQRLDEEFEKRVEENKAIEEAKLEKNQKKRQKKKARIQQARAAAKGKGATAANPQEVLQEKGPTEGKPADSGAAAGAPAGVPAAPRPAATISQSYIDDGREPEEPSSDEAEGSDGDEGSDADGPDHPHKTSRAKAAKDQPAGAAQAEQPQSPPSAATAPAVTEAPIAQEKTEGTAPAQ